MKILKIVPDTIADGPGLRTSIYFAGCSHHCEGCHNPESWDFNQGIEYSAQELLIELTKYNSQKITLSGGDPLDQNLEELSELLFNLKYDPNCNIWCYTGYTFEQILDWINNPPLLVSEETIRYNEMNNEYLDETYVDPNWDKYYIEEVLDNIDVLVDSPFVQSLKDTTLPFRGSSNQRIINIKESLEQNKVILWNKKNL